MEKRCTVHVGKPHAHVYTKSSHKYIITKHSYDNYDKSVSARHFKNFLKPS